MTPFTVGYADPIQKAVDDYVLMEAKARAWDELRDMLEPLPGDSRAYVWKLLDKMDRLLQTAKPSA